MMDKENGVLSVKLAVNSYQMASPLPPYRLRQSLPKSLRRSPGAWYCAGSSRLFEQIPCTSTLEVSNRPILDYKDFLEGARLPSRLESPARGSAACTCDCI